MANPKMPAGKTPTGGPKKDDKSTKNKSTETSKSEKSGDGAHRPDKPVKMDQIAFKPGFVVLDTGTRVSKPGKKSK